MNPWEQSDLGPYYLQDLLSKNMNRREEQTTKTLTSRGGGGGPIRWVQSAHQQKPKATF